MNDDPVYESWRLRRRDAAPAAGFPDRVMAALPPMRSASPSRAAKAAVLLLAAAVFAGRVAALFLLFWSR